MNIQEFLANLNCVIMQGPFLHSSGRKPSKFEYLCAKRTEIQFPGSYLKVGTVRTQLLSSNYHPVVGLRNCIGQFLYYTMTDT